VRVLVTGASGFVGSEVVRSWSEAGHEVIAAGRNAPSSTRGHRWVFWDLTQPAPTTELPNAQVIVHCAGQAHASSATADDYRRLIVLATSHLLTAAKAMAEPPTFVYLSSIKAMGEVLPVGSNEQSVPAPTTPYGRAKLDSERLVHRAHEEGVLERAVSLRPSPVHGPGGRGVIGVLARLGARGLLPDLREKTGERSYVAVRDLARATLACIDLPHQSAVFCVSDDAAYDYAALRQALLRPQPWTRAIPPLGSRTLRLLRSGMFDQRLRLDERLFAPAHVSSRLLQDTTRWRPETDLAGQQIAANAG
jgi:nucleoside-diphosphate-sugar epimerase